MDNKYLGNARNKAEISLALNLAYKVFAKKSPNKMLALPNKSLNNKNVVVFKIENKVMATCFIYNRLLYFKREKIPCSFLIYICVDKSVRGMGYSKELMNFAIDSCKKNGKKACFVIARKAVDFYYTKFSFFGFSNYPKILIKKELYEKHKKIKFLKLKKSLIDQIIPIYNNTYISLSGAFYRGFNEWEFIIKKAELLGVKLCIIRNENNKTTGYVCFKENNIYEIALKKNINYNEVLNNMFRIRRVDNFILHFGINHPIANNLEDFDSTFSFRKCWYGGHMMRINDHKTFLNINNKLDINSLDKMFNSLEDKNKFKFLVNQKNKSESLINEIYNIPLMDQV